MPAKPKWIVGTDDEFCTVAWICRPEINYSRLWGSIVSWPVRLRLRVIGVVFIPGNLDLIMTKTIPAVWDGADIGRRDFEL